MPWSMATPTNHGMVREAPVCTSTAAEASATSRRWGRTSGHSHALARRPARRSRPRSTSAGAP
jgi:hypothetical protein